MPAALIQDLTTELQNLNGLSVSTPQTTTLRTQDPRNPADSMEVQIDFVEVDRLSCALRELRLNIPSMSHASPDVLREWADALCQRITYLLENMGPLEFEPDAGKILIRSTSPTQQPNKRLFYEVLLHANSGGSFSLRRYEAIQGQPGRDFRRFASHPRSADSDRPAISWKPSPFDERYEFRAGSSIGDRLQRRQPARQFSGMFRAMERPYVIR